MCYLLGNLLAVLPRNLSALLIGYLSGCRDTFFPGNWGTSGHRNGLRVEDGNLVAHLVVDGRALLAVASTISLTGLSLQLVVAGQPTATTAQGICTWSAVAGFSLTPKSSSSSKSGSFASKPSSSTTSKSSTPTSARSSVTWTRALRALLWEKNIDFSKRKQIDFLRF